MLRASSAAARRASWSCHPARTAEVQLIHEDVMTVVSGNFHQLHETLYVYLLYNAWMREVRAAILLLADASISNAKSANFASLAIKCRQGHISCEFADICGFCTLFSSSTSIFMLQSRFLSQFCAVLALDVLARNQQLTHSFSVHLRMHNIILADRLLGPCPKSIACVSARSQQLTRKAQLLLHKCDMSLCTPEAELEVSLHMMSEKMSALPWTHSCHLSVKDRMWETYMDGLSSEIPSVRSLYTKIFDPALWRDVKGKSWILALNSPWPEHFLWLVIYAAADICAVQHMWMCARASGLNNSEVTACHMHNFIYIIQYICSYVPCHRGTECTV